MKKKIGTCRLCGKNTTLVDSHVIPKALHRDTLVEDEVIRIYSDKILSSQRSPIGVYGQFLCGSCEASFGIYDEYGIEFVRTYKDGTGGDLIEGSREHGFTVSVNYTTLKLWVMSMLWRADVCDHPLFSAVSLGGKWHNKLKQSILSQSPGPSEYFSVTATLFNDGPLGQMFMADPHPEKHSGVNYYRFYIYGGFTFFIKVDQRKQPSKLEPVSLRESEQFVIIRRKLSNGERKMLQKISNRISDGAD